MTVWSYAGNMNLNVLTDRRVIPDAWVLVDYFQECLAELLDKVEHEKRPAGPYPSRDAAASSQIGR
jgi:hypothetical protein